MKEVINITPNPKMIESLRYLTYKNHTALADLVDNSLDADADQVRLIIDKNNDEILIIDDGCGMDKATLTEAIKFGSETNKDASELGRFGMGLVTASISMARRIEVISRPADSKTHKIVLDLDRILETHDWNAHFEPLTAEDEALLSDLARGTIVRLTHIDKFDRQSVSNTKAHFGEVFRKFIESGREIFVNDETILPYDPLESAADSTDIIYDDEAEIKGKTFHLKIAHIGKDISRLSNNSRNYNISNQGFYIVRNNRQIAAGISLDIFKRHNDLNRFRAEIDCSSEFDDILNINFTKDEINMTQAMRDKLSAIVMPYIDIIRATDRKKKSVKESDQISHNEAEQIIKRRKALLPTSNGLIEKRSPRTSREHSDRSSSTTATSRERKNIRKVQVGPRNFPAVIKEVDLGPNGDLFEDVLEGNQLEIRWNIQHPFHTEIMAKYSQDKDITTPMDLLIYSLVWSKHCLPEDQHDIFYNTMNIMSNTLRTLMKQ